MSATARNGAIGRERNSAQEQQEEHPKVDPISVHSDFEVDTADNDGDQRNQAKTAADDRAACRRTIDEHEVVEKLAAASRTLNFLAAELVITLHNRHTTPLQLHNACLR